MQPVFQLFDLKPIGVERHHIRRPVLPVVPVKVLFEPFKYFGGIVAVQHTLVQVRAMAALICLHVMGVQWNFPCACRLSKRYISDRSISGHLCSPISAHTSDVFDQTSRKRERSFKTSTLLLVADLEG